MEEGRCIASGRSRMFFVLNLNQPQISSGSNWKVIMSNWKVSTTRKQKLRADFYEVRLSNADLS
jgi:hypothetical protein